MPNILPNSRPKIPKHFFINATYLWILKHSDSPCSQPGTHFPSPTCSSFPVWEQRNILEAAGITSCLEPFSCWNLEVFPQIKTILCSERQAPNTFCLKRPVGQWETGCLQMLIGEQIATVLWKAISVKITTARTLIRQTHLWKFIFCKNTRTCAKGSAYILRYSLQGCFLKDRT